MNFIEKNGRGLAACLALAVPAYLLGMWLPMVGGPVFAILLGMAVALVWREKGRAASGIGFTSKYILQTAVVLLGFGLNLTVIMATGAQSLPIIVCTILTSLVLAYVMQLLIGVGTRTATLVGVGSSICGGSAIAATAPVIGAKGGEVAQAISVIFFYNVIAALIFPLLGQALGMDTTTGEAFGIFAGTAVNDTSSVTATAATWDSMFGLGSATLDKAVTVKLTRTLAIIPITLVLALWTARKEDDGDGDGFSLKRAFPMFIFYFILASIATTAGTALGISPDAFAPLKELSKFLIVMAMAAIGLSGNVVELIKTGGKPLALGAVCWIGIASMSLVLQKALGLW